VLTDGIEFPWLRGYKSHFSFLHLRDDGWNIPYRVVTSELYSLKRSDRENKVTKIKKDGTGKDNLHETKTVGINYCEEISGKERK
jgi:hypothetical protein